MDREEVQSRRAYNQIWNGAGRYDIRPEQAAFDAEGDADLYMNTVMGLAYEQYDFARFQPMLHSFQQQIKGGLYSVISSARAAASVSSGPTPSGLWAEPTPARAPVEGERESPCAF